MEALGSNIKGYEVRERIGTGGFGAVYRAYQTTVGREVAIKVILPSLASRPEFIRRFETEAQLVARLEHLHITPLYDYWRDPDGAYLVMRYLRGGSLRDAIARSAYDVEAASLVLDQICAGLAAAHRNQVIHRDLKPGNVLLDEDGNAYLADFGIAKNLALTEDNLTQPDQLIGSPDYLAPEQARSERVTPQTDIYSLGVVLYEMLTGSHPYPGLNPIERLYKHLNEPIPAITSLDPKIRDAVNKVIQKATAKNPAHRFADALELAVAFREAAALSPTHAGDQLVELLTPREQEILQLIIAGKSNREIATALVVELTTVKWYITQIYQKLNVRSRVQAIVRARELNLIVGAHSGDTPITFSMLPEPKNPYKGLHAFQVADEQDFFGREKLIQRMIKRLGAKEPYSRFLAIIGPSGSGKSSVVKAGLIPALWRGELAGSERWYIVEMVPGMHPLDELEVALTRIAASSMTNLREQLERDERGLNRAAQILLPDDGSDLLLVIDQFEELFTLTEDEAERQHFLAMLHAAVTDPRSRVQVVISLRADFYDRPLQYPNFGEMVRSRMETVLPMGAEELERAINQPAERVGISFEEGLISAIVADVHYQPGALPLLQYALTELFECRSERALTHDAYQQIGRAVGALAKRAEELYGELSIDGQAIVRQMFLRLVTPGEGTEDTRRRVPRDELLAMAEDTDLMDEIVDSFAAYRLLSLDRDPTSRAQTVEVAHEALLREWERLRDWLDESRDDIRRQRQLASVASEWEVADHERSFLLTGSRLEQFELWAAATELALTPHERDYLRASAIRRDEERATEQVRQSREAHLKKRAQRVLQGLVGVSLVAAVISGGLALWANTERVRAQTNEVEARRQASIGLGAQAQLEVIQGDPARAVLVALEAVQDYPYTWQAERALGESVAQNPLLGVLEGHDAYITDVKFSPDGTRFLTVSTDGSARVWDKDTGEQLFTVQHPPADPDNSETDDLAQSLWSPDGTRFATASFGGDAIVWNAQTGEKLVQFGSYEEPLTTAIWSPAGTQIVTASTVGTVRIWDARTGEEVRLLAGHTGWIGDVAWSPDGARIATLGWDDLTTRIWDAGSGELLHLLENHDRMNRVAIVSWSPDSQRLVDVSDRIVVVDATTGAQRHVITKHDPYNSGVSWSPDGSRFAIGSLDRTVSVWDVETGEEVMVLTSSALPFAVKWSNSGRYISAGGSDRRVSVWDAQDGLLLYTLSGHDQRINTFAWSPDDTRIVSGSADGQVRLWLGNRRLEELRVPAHGNVPQATWSPDGTHIAAAVFGNGTPEFDGYFRVWNVSTHKEELVLKSEGAGEWIDWSPDGTRLATASSTNPETGAPGGAHLWDAQTGELLLTLNGYQEVYRIFWSPDSTRVVSIVGLHPVENSSLWATAAVVWDAATGEQLIVFEPEQSFGQRSAAWSPDGKHIVTGYAHGFAWIWDAETGEAIRKLQVDAALIGLDWTADGSRILTIPTPSNFPEGGSDGRMKVWDADTGAMLLAVDPPGGGLWGGSWSPDGTRFAVNGGSPSRIMVFDAQTGAIRLHYDGYFVGGLAVEWSPDGDYLVAGGSRAIHFYPPPSWGGTVVVLRAWSALDELVEYTNACCTELTELTPEQRELYGLPNRPADEPAGNDVDRRLPLMFLAVSGVLTIAGVWLNKRIIG